MNRAWNTIVGDTVVYVSWYENADDSNCGIKTVHNFRAEAFSRADCVDEFGRVMDRRLVRRRLVGNDAVAPGVQLPCPVFTTRMLADVVLNKWVKDVLGSGRTYVMSDRVIGTRCRGLDQLLSDEPRKDITCYGMYGEEAVRLSFYTRDLMLLLTTYKGGTTSLSHVAMNVNHDGYSGIQVCVFTANPSNYVVYTHCAGAYGNTTRGRPSLLRYVRKMAREYGEMFRSTRKTRR